MCTHAFVNAVHNALRFVRAALVCVICLCVIYLEGLYFENRVHLVTKQMRQMRHTLTGMTINNSFALALIRTAEIGVSEFKGLRVRMISALAAAAAAAAGGGYAVVNRFT